uniref:Uncharacterized protein n=1 Tax=Anguilla anguilla TaxID=7936 RepID=A0A0E9QNM1_ANGAN
MHNFRFYCTIIMYFAKRLFTDHKRDYSSTVCIYLPSVKLRKQVLGRLYS